MRTFDSFGWTGRRPYRWTRFRFFTGNKYFMIHVGMGWIVDAWGVEVAAVPNKRKDFGESRYRFGWSKWFVTMEEVLNV